MDNSPKMWSHKGPPNLTRKYRLALVGTLLPALLSARSQTTPVAASTTPRASPTTNSAWATSASLGSKELYDSNVFMQSVTPFANHASLVTVITPSVGVQWKPSSAFSLSMSYSPEIAFYHSAHSEDYVSHKGALNLTGQVQDTTWEFLNGITWIDGNDLSPTFYGVGGAPALGGVPLRDRREAAIYRDSFKLQQRFGEWFLRAAGSSYVHDFMTRHRPNPPGGGVYRN